MPGWGVPLACGSLVLLSLTTPHALPALLQGKNSGSSILPMVSKKNGLAGEQEATAAALWWPQPRKDTEMYLGRFHLWKNRNFSSLNHQGSKCCKAWGQEVAVNWVTGKETQLAARGCSGAPARRSRCCSSQQRLQVGAVHLNRCSLSLSCSPVPQHYL